MRGSLFLTFILLSQVCHAQDFLRAHYTVDDGLADNQVQSILEDSRGFMWFGTAEGLSRFDGANFKNYFTNKDSLFLSSNFTPQLTETKPGHIMLIHVCQLVGLNTITGKFYRPRSFANRQVCGLHKISASRYLVAATDTCFVVDQDLKILETLTLPSTPRHGLVFGIPLERNIHLFGMLNDVSQFHLYDPRTKDLTHLDLKQSTAERDNLSFSFYDSTRQWLYFANYFSGIYRYSLHGERLKFWPLFGYGRVNKINDTLLWIGGTVEKRGALLLNLKNDEMIPLRINNEVDFDALVLYEDKAGKLWAGTSKGVSKLTLNNLPVKTWKTFPGQPDGVPFPVNIVKGKDQQLYLSFFTLQSLYRFDQGDDTWKLFSKDLITGPWCVNPVGDEIIFTGGQTTRFTTYNPTTGSFRHSSDFLKKYFPNSDILILAFQHSNGDRWYSGNKGGGFVRVSAGDGSIQHYTKDGPRGHFGMGYYANHAEDSSGDLWFGVNKTRALLHWNKERNWFSEVLFDTVPGMKGVRLAGINKIIRDKNDNLWIGFEGTGLVKYDHVQNRAVHYTIQDGLASDYIGSLAFDGNGRLWIGTPKGLNCLVIKENKIQTITAGDGLLDDGFDDGFIYYDEVSNKIWLGAKSSIMRFDPDELLAEVSHQIRIYMDELYLNGKQRSFEVEEILQLNHKENSIQFRFVAINIDGKPIQFSYLLEGHDKEWVDNLYSTTASYANLKPGNYTFKVRGNYKGDSSTFYFSRPFGITIATPWFSTVWFRVTVAAVGSLFIAMLIQSYYTRKNEKEKLVLEKQHAIEKERTRIATDMHDDFGASLSRIKFISEKIKLQTHGEVDLTHDLTKISSYSDQMAEKMNEIVWALNERNDSLEDLVSFSRAYAADYLMHHSIQLNFNSHLGTNLKVNGEVRRNVFLVIKESLHNIVKHAQATEVDIYFHFGDKLKVVINDNGKGFDINQIRPFANGISNMKKRMKDIGGQLEVLNERGTSITVTTKIS